MRQDTGTAAQSSAAGRF